MKKPGGNTRGLLAYLYGPGRHDEHHDPHIVASLSPRGLPNPGRDPDATLTRLGQILDAPVHLRNEGFGKPVTDHVWHCPVRAAPGDRYLSDAEWGEIARRIVHAAGIAPDRDPLACRWIAVRHQDDHIHILATTVREDGRRPKIHNCGMRAQAEARLIETELGLHRKSRPATGPGTAAPPRPRRTRPSASAGSRPAPQWLQERIRAAIPHAASVEELFAYLEADGVEVKVRRLPSGDLQGCSVGRPGDLKADGTQVYISGGKVAPDLSLPKLRDRLGHSRARGAADGPPQPAQPPAGSAPPAPSTPSTTTSPARSTKTAPAEAGTRSPWGRRTGTSARHRTRRDHRRHRPGRTPPSCGTICAPPSRPFARAQRSRIRADHHTAAGLRPSCTRHRPRRRRPRTAATFAVLLTALVWSAILAARWHQSPWPPAASRSSPRPPSATSKPPTTRPPPHTSRPSSTASPTPEITNTSAGAVRSAIPDNADRILTDPNWPALATVLADAHAAGHPLPRISSPKPPARRKGSPSARPCPPKVLLGRIDTPAATPHPTPAPKPARLRSHAARQPPPQPQSRQPVAAG